MGDAHMRWGFLAVFLTLICLLGVVIPWWRGTESRAAKQEEEEEEDG